MKLTPIANAITVAATRLGVALSARAEGIAMQAAISPIQLAYEIGYWILRINKLDPVGVNDGAGVLGELFTSFFKKLVDNAAVAEDIAFEFRKNLQDQAGLTDNQVMDFFKSLADPAVVREAKSLGVSKPRFDAASTTDEAFRSFYKALVDGAGFTDHEAMAFYKQLVDGVPVFDVATADVSKVLADEAGTTDAQLLVLTKALADQVNVTDDIDGAASIADEQTMAFVKQTTDAAQFTDLFYRVIAFTRGFEDSASTTDAHTVGLDKPLSDSAGFTDATAQDFGKAAEDVATLDDSTLIFDSGKALADPVAIDDLAAKSFTRAPMTNETNVTDLPSMGPGLVKSESALLTDSGSLRSQGYCDFSYFAEDYVGASRTF